MILESCQLSLKLFMFIIIIISFRFSSFLFSETKPLCICDKVKLSFSPFLILRFSDVNCSVNLHWMYAFLGSIRIYKCITEKNSIVCMLITVFSSIFCPFLFSFYLIRYVLFLIWYTDLWFLRFFSLWKLGDLSSVFWKLRF